MKPFGKFPRALQFCVLHLDMQNEAAIADRKYHPTGNLDEEDLPKSERHRLHREEFLRGQA